jgi:hypothetical protein
MNRLKPFRPPFGGIEAEDEGEEVFAPREVSSKGKKDRLRPVEEDFVPAFPLRLLGTREVSPLAVLVFLALWRMAALHHGQCFPVNQSNLLRPWDRPVIRRAFRQLEKARWIKVARPPGCLIEVKVLKVLRRKGSRKR